MSQKNWVLVLLFISVTINRFLSFPGRWFLYLPTLGHLLFIGMLTLLYKRDY